MGKLFAALKRLPRRTSALVAIVAAAVIIPATLFAWGPNRDTYTVANPANKVVFNSITDNPHIGDERNFVNVRDAAITTDGGWQDTLNAEPGKEYMIRMYVHNNANANLNLKALNTRVKASIPATTGKKVSMSGFVSADNASPKEVWDDIHFTSTKDFNLVYVPGSAEIRNNVTGPAGKKLPDSIVTSTGAPVSYTEEGVIPGCFEFASYVYFKVKPQFAPEANFEIQKTVRKSGDKDFVENVSVKPGDKVDFQIYYKNTGDQQMKNVVVRDTLPAGMTYEPGTTWLHNSGGTRQVADGLTTAGLDIGGYMPNGNAYVKFTAKVNGNDSLPACGPNVLRNVAKVETDYGTKEDDAKVNVPKECKPECKYSCDSLKITKIDRTKFKFETKYTAENVTLKKIEYVIRDESGKEIARQTSDSYTQTTVGKYTVQAIVTVTVDGHDKVAPGDCKQPFEVVKENLPAVTIDKKVDGIEHKTVGINQEFTYEIVVKNTGDVDLTNLAVSDKAPNGVTFVKASAGAIVSNAWNHTIASLRIGQSTSFTITAKVPAYLAGKIVNTACVDTPQIPGNPDDCDDASIEVPKTPETPKNPEIPTELPKTGMDDGILALIGAGSLIATLGYYIASRRALSA